MTFLGLVFVGYFLPFLKFHYNSKLRQLTWCQVYTKPYKNNAQQNKNFFPVEIFLLSLNWIVKAV